MKQFNNLTIPIIFFGSSSYVLPIIEVLHKNFDLKLVVTTERPFIPQGDALQGDALKGSPVIRYCVENKILYLSVSSSSDLIHNSSFMIHNSFLGVLADFGLIIPEDILSVFPKGIINIHPSLLPKYRGPTPVQTAILNGAKETGVSIIKLDGKIDHGPILGQEKEKILDTDTAESLYKRLFEKGANLLLKVLNLYSERSLNPTAQDHKKATFTKPLTRADGFIDISKFKIKNSIKIKNLKLKIRAYFPWPGAWTRLNLGNKEKIVKLLPENKIQVEGKKPMSYRDFTNGFPGLQQIHVLLNQL